MYGGIFMKISKPYFASANTSAGFVSFYKYIMEECERAYILKGGPGSGKNEFIERMGEDLLDVGFEVHFVYSSQSPSLIDGIVVNDINVVVVDGTSPHLIDPIYPGAVERILNFEDYCDIDYLRDNKKAIKYYTDRVQGEYKKFYECMKSAKIIHDRLEKEYEIGMNFNKADSIAENIIREYITEAQSKKARVYHRFAGVMTSEGQVSFYENLTRGIRNRLILKGRAGTGKSTLNKKIANEAIKLGYDVEYYHCSFDPQSIDMIIIPELSFAILDGTAPHVFDPIGNDKLVDMFLCIDTSIVKETEEPIKGIEVDYKNEIEKSRDVLKNIKELQEELEKYYRTATDFNDVNALRIRITNTLLEMRK